MATTKKKPSTPEKPKKEKPVAAAVEKKPPVVRGPRRSPYELVQSLKYKRDLLNELHLLKLGKLSERIAALEAKHAEKITIGEMLVENTPEELQADFEELKRRQALLRKALKHQKSSEPA